MKFLHSHNTLGHNTSTIAMIFSWPSDKNLAVKIKTIVLCKLNNGILAGYLEHFNSLCLGVQFEIY